MFRLIITRLTAIAGSTSAKLTIAALMADQCKHGRALAAIFQAIVNDAIRRGEIHHQPMPALRSGRLTSFAKARGGPRLPVRSCRVPECTWAGFTVRGLATIN
jgi:hypothetical protein